MIQMEIKDSHRLINAGSVIVITAQDNERKTITPIAWHMPVSGSPKIFAIALALKHYSLELIESSFAFCINVPEYDLKEKVIYCGSVSGRDENKVLKSGLSTNSCEMIDNFYISECFGRIECEVKDIIAVGDHKLVLGHARSAWCREGIMTEDQTIDMSKIDLLQHLGGQYLEQ